MAVYFNHHFDIQGAPVNAWSKPLDTPPVLAVALSGNAVGVYTEDGQPLDNSQEQLIRNVRGCEASQLTWHPVQPLLAIGWADGALSLWLLKPRRISGEESARHRTAIAKLAWSPDGERLYSADGGGRVAVWSCSAEWRPQLLASFDVPKSSITHLVPMQQYASPTGRRSSASDEPGPAAPRPSSGDFLFSTRQADDASVIYKGSDKGTSAKLFEIDSHLLSVFYYADKDQIICVASTRILTVHGKDGADAPWKVLTKLKFSTGQAEPSGPGLSLAWAGPHTLASASGTDTVVRMFNFDTEDNFTLELPAEEDGAVGSRASDTIALLHYDPQLCCLAAATASGKMAVFRHSPEREQDSALDSRVNVELAWEAEPVFRLKAAPLAVAFGPSIRLLSATCTQDLTLCRRARLQWRYCNGVAAVQTSANQVMVVNVEGGGAPRHITCDVQVQGLAVNKEVLALSDGKLVKVYGLSDGDIQPLSSFATTSPSIAVFSSHVIKAGVGRLELLTPQGVVKQTVEFDAVHGQPILMDGNGKSLVVLTNRMAIRVFTLRGRQMKETSLPGSISAQRLQEKSCSEPWGEVESMRVNCQGSKVSLLMHDASDRTRFDSRLLLYDVELDLVDVFDFQKDKRTPVYHCWDTQEPKLLAVQTRCRKEDVGRKGSTALPGVEITTPMADSGEDVLTEVATLFATAGDSQSLILQEYQELRAQQWLVAISAPQLVVCNQGQGGAESRPSSAKAVKKAAHSALVTGLTMRSFAGMDVADDASRQALLDFSFKLSTGDMAGASAAFRVIKNPAVWESMAAMCVKNKRLDVLELCLSNLEHVRGARALREAAAEEEADARIGLAALHLGLTEDAAKLFEAAGRYDLLNRLHQARGEWDAAVDLAESHDRVHLASIRHERGRALEMQGDVQGAIREYEAAGTHHTEVPRLLASLGCMDDLEQYVQAKPQPPLQRWLARWYESRGQNDKALPLYQAAKDMLAQVRLLCLQGDYEGAKQLVADSGDPAAAFELARKLEANDLGEEAIEFYRTAGRLPHAVRLAQKFGMEQKVFKLAQQSSKAAMLDTAQYFQDRGEYEKAAVLFQKAGLTSRALKMCFDGQLYEALSQIADDLNDTTDPQVLINCAEFFLQQGEIGRAAALLIRAGQQRRALQLCEQESVPLTEEMAEGLSPEKGSMPEPERLAVLAQVARLCKHQGAFQVAAKKYTQAGERKKALKMLMRAGDWEKVVFFANVSRSREIFEAAADYLVTLSWHCQPEVMRSIIAFYKKAKASQKLAAFWESCAQLEIDEYRDYYKALDALRAALQLIQKPDGSGGKAEEQLMARASKLDSLQRRINLMERFTRAMENEPNEARPGNPQMMLQICEELIMEVPDDVQDSEACIRVGDVYSMVIGYYDGQRQWQQAYSMMEQMRNRGIVLNPYLDRKLIERVCQGAGVDIASLGLAAAAAAQPGAADTSFTEGDIAEEVVEEASDV